MNLTETELPGVLLVEPDVYRDSRGSFLELWNTPRYFSAGFPDVRFVQVNCSRSSRDALRGLHFQLHEPQGKLLQVTSGRVFDVAADVRIGSPTFGRWVGYVLDDENRRQLYVPPGFAHGFVALSNHADLVYQCTSVYDSASDGGIRFDDPDLRIDWPTSSPLLSEKDQRLPNLKEAHAAGRLPRYQV